MINFYSWARLHCCFRPRSFKVLVINPPPHNKIVQKCANLYTFHCIEHAASADSFFFQKHGVSLKEKLKAVSTNWRNLVLNVNVNIIHPAASRRFIGENMVNILSRYKSIITLQM